MNFIETEFEGTQFFTFAPNIVHTAKSHFKVWAIEKNQVLEFMIFLGYDLVLLHQGV